MDSMDNIGERFAALEQRTEQLQQQTHAFEVQTHALQAHTRTVERRLRWWRGLACGVGLLGLVSLPLPSGTAQDKSKRSDLAQRVAAMEDKLQFVTSGEKELVMTGANLRIVNGLGSTDAQRTTGIRSRIARMGWGTLSLATTKSAAVTQTIVQARTTWWWGHSTISPASAASSLA